MRNFTGPPDWKLAQAIRYVLRRGGWPERSCRPDHLRRIASDRALAAYLESVHEADAWDEEISRVRRRQMERRRARKWAGDGSDAGGGELSATAVQDLLPTWRGWGNLLLAAERHAKPSLLA